MLRHVVIFVVSAIVASANPISAALISPPHTMIAENVLVGVTEKGAVVSGRYRFHVAPDAAENWLRPPYRLRVHLPVPIARSLKEYEDIEAVVHPFMTIRGARYFPLREVFYFEMPSLPREAKLVAFIFEVERPDLGEEFDLTIQYDQPIFTVGGKELVYYVPFLPTFERYRQQMRLNPESYLITFEAYGGSRLLLAQPVERVKKSEPTSIAVQPQHRELIAVERVARARP